MAIKPVCDFCKKELNAFGGLLFSPPNKQSVVKKYHLSDQCYKAVLQTRKN